MSSGAAGRGLRALRAFALRAAVAWVALAAAAGALAPASASAQQTTRPKWDTRVLAQVPSPGFPALSLVGADRRIFVGSFENPAGDSITPKLFRFGPDGSLETSFSPGQQDLSMPHGYQVAAQDGQGFLYVLQQSPPRVLRVNPNDGTWTYYASFAQVPPCSSASPGTECKQATADNPSEPDYAAWGTDGSLYVTDYQQALIWKVPPGGGTAHVWFTDPRLDGVQFDAAGIVLMPDHRTLLFDTAASAPSTGPDYTQGKLYQLPIQPDGRPGTLRQLWESGPREAPDGFALAQSGNVYLALVGPGVDQLVEISPQGQELGRYPPDEATNNARPIPYDEPSSVQFDGERMIVTNLSYFQGNASHQVLFDVWAGEPGMPVYHPPAALTAPAAAAPAAGQAPGRLQGLILRASRRHLRPRRRARVVFTVTLAPPAEARPVAGVTVRVGARTAVTGGTGQATIVIRPRRRGTLRVVAAKPGYSASQLELPVLRRRGG